MTKTLYRYQRNSSDAETRLLRLWQSAISPVDAFYAQMSDGLFRNLKWVMAEKIGLSAGNDGRLASCDEKIYEYYRKLIFFYDKALWALQDSGAALARFPGHRAVEITNGIRAVITSRINSFNQDRRQLAQPTDPELSGDDRDAVAGNPVKTEKNMLISRGIRNFSENFDITAYRCRSELYGKCFHNVRKAFLAALNPSEDEGDSIYDQVLTVMGEISYKRLYELYAEAVRLTTASLNDFYQRNAAAYYNEQLYNEHEILKNLATVQVQALDKETALLPLEAKETVDAAVRVLLEAYQTLSHNVAEITDFFKQAATVSQEPMTEDFAEFAAGLEEAAVASFGLLSWDDALTAFGARLSVMGDAFAAEARKAAETAVLEYRKLAAEDAGRQWGAVHEMTDTICQAFRDISCRYLGDPTLTGDSGLTGSIVKGIAESVEIKAQSLEENVLALDAEITAHPLFEETPKTDADQTAALADGVFSSMIGELILFLKEDRRALSTVRKYSPVNPGSPLTSGLLERLRPAIARGLDEIQRKIRKFLKEHLLYEISTFEEIQHYSVSRLRESEDQGILDFVAYIDAANAGLLEILGANGIELISPEPGDAFNGKEHEVLMAEKNDDYKKGEIIKLMNSGYKRGADIILRANVIASR